jgi:hypothetical protein
MTNGKPSKDDTNKDYQAQVEYRNNCEGKEFAVANLVSWKG